MENKGHFYLANNKTQWNQTTNWLTASYIKTNTNIFASYNFAGETSRNTYEGDNSFCNKFSIMCQQ